MILTQKDRFGRLYVQTFHYFDDDVEVSLASAEIDAFYSIKELFCSLCEMEDVKPYCSSKLLDLSVSILVRITLLIIIAISHTLLKFR